MKRGPATMGTRPVACLGLFLATLSLTTAGILRSKRETGCGGKFTGLSGQITSPGWPSGHQNGLHCIYNIVAPPNHTIILTLTDVVLQNPDRIRRSHGTLKVYDGGNTSHSSLMYRRYIETKLKRIESSGNKLTVELTTTEIGTSGHGFRALYTAMPHPDCAGHYTGMSGQITSPGWPDNYQNNSYCVYKIEVPYGHAIILNFTDFDLEYEQNCTFSYVEVYNGGDRGSGLLLPKTCGSSAPHIEISTGDKVTVVFEMHDSNTPAHFRLEYLAFEDEGCGGTYTALSGEITSPKWPAIYPNSVHCEYDIEIPFNHIVLLNFTDFDLENSVECIYDSIVVWYGGKSSQLSGEHLEFCGNTLPASKAFFSSILRIDFETDSDNKGFGFRVLYNILRVPGCGGTYGGLNGQITSPELPSSTSLNYLYCLYTVEVPPGHTILLDVIEFTIPRYFHRILDDYLEVYDGDSPNAPLLTAFRDGHSSPATTESSGNKILLVYKTDYLIYPHENNFRAQYTAVEITETTTLPASYPQATTYSVTDESNTKVTSYAETTNDYITKSAGECGGSYSGLKGQITSPGWPDDYENNLRCSYTIEVPPGLGVLLNFTEFHLENSCRCSFDNVVVYDGELRHGWYRLMTESCGSSLPAAIISLGNTIQIEFTTDSSATWPGFRIEYTAVNIPGCGGRYSGLKGQITSPGWPDRYGMNLLCNYIIEVPPDHIVTLSFMDFDLRNRGSCGYTDYVEVYDGESTSSPVLMTKKCGNSLPPTRESSGNKILIVFHTDDYFSRRGGFRAEYTAVETEELFTSSATRHVDLEPTTMSTEYLTPSEEPCGGSFRGLKGRITSPGWPDGYKNNLHCFYNIEVPTYHTVLFKVMDFELEANSQCSYDYLEVYDGESTSSPLLMTKKCGNSLPPTNKSSGNKILIVFKSDGSTTRSGFRAEYTAVEPEETTAMSFTTEPLTTPTPNGGGIESITLSSLYPETTDEIVYTIDSFTSMTEGCGGRYSGLKGHITSPGWPDDYKNYLHCFYIIEVPPGHIVFLEFVEFELEKNSQCGFDSIMVYDGDSTSSPLLMTKKCGNSLPPPGKSSGNKILIVFETDSSTSGSGFRAEYTAVESEETTTWLTITTPAAEDPLTASSSHHTRTRMFTPHQVATSKEPMKTSTPQHFDLQSTTEKTGKPNPGQVATGNPSNEDNDYDNNGDDYGYGGDDTDGLDGEDYENKNHVNRGGRRHRPIWGERDAGRSQDNWADYKTENRPRFNPSIGHGPYYGGIGYGIDSVYGPRLGIGPRPGIYNTGPRFGPKPGIGYTGPRFGGLMYGQFPPSPSMVWYPFRGWFPWGG